ncbi:MAG: class I SAM-dependent methyltransferase [Opitutaceae bacterium]
MNRREREILDYVAMDQRGSTPAIVVTCYDFFDRLFPECGIDDFTEGIYCGDPSLPYEEAQRNQHDWLLDRAECVAGTVLLDIGCGSGSLLEHARERGCGAVGINVSPRQVVRCRKRGLDVRLLDYRSIGQEWNDQFDAIIANGSVEHFVQPRDVLEDRADTIYEEMFRLCRRLLDPASMSRRLVTTIIHFDRFVPDPRELLRSPFNFDWGSDLFHAALLEKTMGGYYPVEGQLERCAQPFFDLISQEDGTEDYRRTSEEWLARVRRNLLSFSRGWGIWRDLLPFVVRHPSQSLLSLLLLSSESWQWQFRGKRPPTKLLRQTWRAR